MNIFCDFDGTVARNDVGAALFRTFTNGQCHDIVERWKRGEMSSKQRLMEECRLLKASRQELERFVDLQELDPHFEAFVRFCHARHFHLEIVSDGFEFYIRRMLRNHELDDAVQVHANRLVFDEAGTPRPQFPYYEKGCGACANCKGYHVRRARRRAPGEPIVYVGDGLSDRCGAEAADVIFAKRDLAQFCETRELAYHPFDTFKDVRETLLRMLG